MPTSLIETGVRLQGSALIVQGTRLGSHTLSTHALMRSGILQLTKWVLLDAVIDAGTPAIQRTLFHYGAEYEPASARYTTPASYPTVRSRPGAPSMNSSACRLPRRTHTACGVRSRTLKPTHTRRSSRYPR